METKVKENGTAVNKEVKSANLVTEENKHPKFVAGNTVNKDSIKPQPESEKLKEAPKAEAAKAPEQPKAAKPNCC